MPNAPRLPNGLLPKEDALVMRRIQVARGITTESLAASYRAVYPASKGNDRTCTEMAVDVLKRPHVKARYESLQRALTEHNERELAVSAEEVLAKRWAIASFTPKGLIKVEGNTVFILPTSQWNDQQWEAVSGIIQHTDSHGVPTSVELKFYDKLKALEGVADQQGYNQKQPVGGNTYNFTTQEVMVIGLVGDPEARRALDVLAERLEGQSGRNGG